MIPFRKTDAGDWVLLAVVTVVALWAISHFMGWTS